MPKKEKKKREVALHIGADTGGSLSELGAELGSFSLQGPTATRPLNDAPSSAHS